jgi:prepilin-type N-terminal cleavage/methylation domain-containing protein
VLANLHRAAPRGFSLLELLVVVALASVLAGIGALNHHAMQPGLRLGMAARQVVMELKVARMHAVARNVNHRVVFPGGGTSYQRQRKAGSVYIDEGTPVALPPGIVIAGCNAVASAIGFRPRGNAATFGTVTIQNTRGETRRIIVDIAGEVRVQ